MAFQTLDYLLFLLVMLGLHWIAPRIVQRIVLLAAAIFLCTHGQLAAGIIAIVVLLAEQKWRMAQASNLPLLLSSYFFYAYIHPWYALLIGLTSIIDWMCGLAIRNKPAHKKLFLVLSLATNFSILAAFKYFGFFMENAIAVAASVGIDLDQPHWRVLLPVGISFYTFQSASYVVDVFRNQVEPRRNLFDYALFVSFFPQLVAGPIERAGHLLAQVEAKRVFLPERARQGMVLALWGLFQKLCIADNAALITNKVFALKEPSFPVLWAGVLAFGVQIYADFSAYTNMARGSASLFGFDLCRNFNHPYLAANPADFWRRWHISLSTWFRDYVYIPLGGNRMGDRRTIRNLCITFGLSGLWHGANWNFIFWGLFHGALVSAWHLIDKFCPRLAHGGGHPGKWMRILTTFILVHIGWLIFREQNLAYLGRAFGLNPLAADASEWRIGLFLASQTLLYALPLWILPILEKWTAPETRWGQSLAANPHSWKNILIDSAVAALLIGGILLLACEVGSDFIYFQF